MRLIDKRVLNEVIARVEQCNECILIYLALDNGCVSYTLPPTQTLWKAYTPVYAYKPTTVGYVLNANLSCVSGSVMVYKTSWLESSLDYADKTQLATTAECRSKRSRTVLFRVLLNNQVRLWDIFLYTFTLYLYNRHNIMNCAYKEKRDVQIERVRQQYICGLSWEKNNLTVLSMNSFMYYLF